MVVWCRILQSSIRFSYRVNRPQDVSCLIIFNCLGGGGCLERKNLYWIENNLLFVDKNKGFPIFGTCT